MTCNYAYAPHIRPLFFTVIFLLALAAYGWSRRSAPGALVVDINALLLKRTRLEEVKAR